MRIFFNLCIAICLPFCCATAQQDVAALASQELRRTTFALSEVMLHDVANPPAASRFYAYALLAGYEIVSREDTQAVRSLQGVLRDLPALPDPDKYPGQITPLSALLAILETGKKIMPSGYLLTDKQNELIDQFGFLGISHAAAQASQDYAIAMAGQISAYAKNDRYIQLSALSRYRPGNGAGDWVPTPPDWMAAVEPHWNTIRPFLLLSPDQFRPPDPMPFDTAAGSPFMSMAREVYDTREKMDRNREHIALFWDCNPFAVRHEGHMKIGIKKISPAGHWVNIAGLACEKARVPFSEALRIHTWMALGVADAFIGCWNEKYRSNRIRPVTVINRTLDPSWKPFLQTPPFPEYVSGHSTASAAAAEILTDALGDHFKLKDDSESLYGIKPRRFSSFFDMAEEASLSRLYGGIHFRDALDNGLWLGRQIGRWALSRLHDTTTPKSKGID